jgi:hypothetical protein
MGSFKNQMIPIHGNIHELLVVYFNITLNATSVSPKFSVFSCVPTKIRL